jgi:hypothetical protein
MHSTDIKTEAKVLKTNKREVYNSISNVKYFNNKYCTSSSESRDGSALCLFQKDFEQWVFALIASSPLHLFTSSPLHLFPPL